MSSHTPIDCLKLEQKQNAAQIDLVELTCLRNNATRLAQNGISPKPEKTVCTTVNTEGNILANNNSVSVSEAVV